MHLTSNLESAVFGMQHLPIFVPFWPLEKLFGGANDEVAPAFGLFWLFYRSKEQNPNER